MQDLVSIIVPVFNNKASLHRHIQSLLRQDYKNFEILFIEYYSIDSSLEILKYYQNRDKRIKIYQIISSNMHEIYSYAIKKSSGKYIYITTPDVILEPNFLSHGISTMKEYKTTLFASQFYVLKDSMLRKEHFITFNQPPEDISLLKTHSYFNELYLNDSDCITKSTSLWNKIIDRKCIKVKRLSNIYLLNYSILENHINIAISNQILVKKITMDNYSNIKYFKEQHLDLISFLEHLLLQAEKEKNIKIQKNISFILMQELYNIKVKLLYPYISLRNLKKLKQIVNLKFNIIRKAADKKEFSTFYTEKVYGLYLKLTLKERSARKHPYVYSKMDSFDLHGDSL